MGHCTVCGDADLPGADGPEIMGVGNRGDDPLERLAIGRAVGRESTEEHIDGRAVVESLQGGFLPVVRIGRSNFGYPGLSNSYSKAVKDSFFGRRFNILSAILNEERSHFYAMYL